MVLEYLQSFFSAGYGSLVLLVVFVLFIIVTRKVVRTIMSAVWIVILSAIFPIAANYFLGFSFPLTLETFVSFVTLGVGLFALYILVKLVYKFLGLFRGSASKGKQDKNAERIKNLEKRLEEEKKQEKAKR